MNSSNHDEGDNLNELISKAMSERIEDNEYCIKNNKISHENDIKVLGIALLYTD